MSPDLCQDHPGEWPSEADAHDPCPPLASFPARVAFWALALAGSLAAWWGLWWLGARVWTALGL